MANQEQNEKEPKKEEEKKELEREEVNDKEEIQEGKQRGGHVLWSTS